jgi:hypothetical protein
VNRYILIRRLNFPAILLLLGIIALMHEAGLASWHLFVPLLLILIGVLKLAERAALAGAGNQPYPGAPFPYGGINPATPGGPQAQQPGTSIVPAQSDFGKGSEGGQS